MTLTVRVEDPRQDAVAALLRQSDALAARLYPGEYRRPLTPETLAVPGIRLLVARTAAGDAAGCCALLEMGDGGAELKRMITGEGFRRQGVGAALLAAAEAEARAAGIGVIRMEVGTRNTEGQALYRRAGYRECGPFGRYQPSPVSLFFGKTLAGT